MNSQLFLGVQVKNGPYEKLPQERYTLRHRIARESRIIRLQRRGATVPEEGEHNRNGPSLS
jgi:hypothetical protein